MKNFLVLGAFLPFFSFNLLVSAGETTNNSPINHHELLLQIGKALDGAQRYVDEYGTITISTPVLTYGQSNRFSFNLTNGAYYYFTNAKGSVQGTAAAFDQRSQTLMFSAQAQVDPMAMASSSIQWANYLKNVSTYNQAQDAQHLAAASQFAAMMANAGTNASQSDRDSAQADALRVYANALGATNGLPQAPQPTTNNPLPALMNPTDLTGTNGTRLIGLLPFLSLASNQPTPTLSDRSAIITAAGNNAVEAIFRALGDPEAKEQFVSKDILIGLTTVSINPGWRTQKNWEGQVMMRADLEFKPARQETVRRLLAKQQYWPNELVAKIAFDQVYPFMDTPNWDGDVERKDRYQRLLDLNISPDRAQKIAQISYNSLLRVTDSLGDGNHLWGPAEKTTYKPISIIIVSPLNDADTYDLASSYRHQSEFTLSLSFALHYIGADVAAKAFEDYAKSLQFDIHTRNELTAINSLSSQDGMIGFRIGPRPTALGNLSKRSSKPDLTLDKQSFPALLLLGIGAGDMEPRLDVATNNATGEKYVVVNEPYIALHQFSSWVPRKGPKLFHTDPDWTEDARVKGMDLLEQAKKLEQAEGGSLALDWTDQFAITPLSTPEFALRERFRFYESQLVGCVDDITLPVERIVPEPPLGHPEVVTIVPSEIKLDATGKVNGNPLTFVLQGTNLDAISDPITALYPNATEITNIAQSANILAIQAMVTNSDYPIIFMLKSKDASSTTLSPPVFIRSAPTQAVATK